MTPFQESIARALHALSERGVRIYLMHGNRDFMIGQTFSATGRLQAAG